MSLILLSENNNLFSYNQIIDNLYQGAWPGYYPEEIDKFDAVVYCAREFQSSKDKYDDKKLIIVNCPLDDSLLTQTQLAKASKAAKIILNLLQDNKKVLTTCHMGINRSGLVNALTLRLLSNIDGKTIVKLIQLRRPGSLTNRSFVNYIESLK